MIHGTNKKSKYSMHIYPMVFTRIMSLPTQFMHHICLYVWYNSLNINYYYLDLTLAYSIRKALLSQFIKYYYLDHSMLNLRNTSILIYFLNSLFFKLKFKKKKKLFYKVVDIKNLKKNEMNESNKFMIHEIYFVYIRV